MAEAAQTLLPPHTVKLVYTAAKDALGDLLQLEMEAVGLRTDGLIQLDNGLATAACSLFLDSNGDLTGGVSDMGIVESLPIEEVSLSFCQKISAAILMRIRRSIGPCRSMAMRFQDFYSSIVT